MFKFVTPGTDGYLSLSCTERETSTKYPPPYLYYFTSGGCDKEGGILEERYPNMYEIPNRGSKVPGYKGGVLPIHNIDGSRNAMEVSDICNLPTLHEVVSDR